MLKYFSLYQDQICLCPKVFVITTLFLQFFKVSSSYTCSMLTFSFSTSKLQTNRWHRSWRQHPHILFFSGLTPAAFRINMNNSNKDNWQCSHPQILSARFHPQPWIFSCFGHFLSISPPLHIIATMASPQPAAARPKSTGFPQTESRHPSARLCRPQVIGWNEKSFFS